MASSIESLLRPELLAPGPGFRERRPFPHLVWEDFLAPEFCDALDREFPAFDEAKAKNEYGKAGGKAVYPELAKIGPAYARLDEMIRSREFLELVSRWTGIEKLIYDPEYVGGGAHLNMSGQDLDMHVDFNYHPRTRLHRRLNLLLFLNRRWEESWGGNLELHLDPRLPRERNEAVKLEPRFNRCVIFETSERSWHGFERIAMPPDLAHLGRRSVAVYYYTKDRPAEETADPHATIYLAPPLPERFREGYQLTRRDEEALRGLIARRDAQIDFLYKREKEFTRSLESPSFKVGRAITWPARMLRKIIKGV